MASTRSYPMRAVQRFSATARKQSCRHLHMTGANSTPSQLLNKDPTVAPSSRAVMELRAERPQPTRHFNTTRSLKAVNDTSTIDFAYMPQYTLETHSHAEIQRIPLLPDNYFPARRSAALQEAMEPVMRPEISTASADGTHIASPSAMSEVTDNHAAELDPYDLAMQVGRAANKVVSEKVEVLREGSVVKELWSGFLDDLLGGSKKASKA